MVAHISDVFLDSSKLYLLFADKGFLTAAFTGLGWAPMFVAPKWKYTITWARIVGFVFLIIYTINLFILTDFEAVIGSMGDNFSWNSIIRLFSSEQILFSGWAHWLGADILLGSWITSDSNKMGVNRVAVIISLFFGLNFGPSGLLFYLVLRWIKLGVPRDLLNLDR